MLDKKESEKNYSRVNFRCEKDLKDEFDEICKKKGIVRSAIFRNAMIELIKKNGD